MKIRLILFDLGGVIYTSDRHEAVRRFGSLGLKDAEHQLNMYTQTGLFGALKKERLVIKNLLHSFLTKSGNRFHGMTAGWRGWVMPPFCRNVISMCYFAYVTWVFVWPWPAIPIHS